MELREYQQQLITDIRTSLRRGNRSVVAVLGCGGGKSIIQADIAKSGTKKGSRVLFLVHRKELCDQIRSTFEFWGVDMQRCDIMMVQTACRRIDNMPEYQLIITDEAHHSTARSYTKIYEAFPEAIRLGFTATPVRLNQGGLGDIYADLITSVSTKWLIDNGFLAPYKYYSVKLADTSGLHTVAGEYNHNEVAALMQSELIYGDTVKQWERLAKGKRTIVYCASVEAAEKTAVQFYAHGYKAISLSGDTPAEVRKMYMQNFRDGNVTVLCNCELFGEGLDVPDCECVVLLRPTQSLSLFIQQSMRSMRYKPGKTAIIIDHVGNCYRHGLPDDDRVWTLESKKAQENMVKIRECPNCFAVYPPTKDRCPYCGYKAVHEIQTVDRRTVDVDLVEVKRRQVIMDTRPADADLHSWEEIVEFQQLHKYKFAWALRYAINAGIPYPEKYNYMVHRFLKN